MSARLPQQRLRIRLVVNFLQTENLIGLRALCSLNDVELDFISFFKALVTLTLDGAVVDKHIRSPFAAQESITLRVVEPLYGAFILCQWSNSLSSQSKQGSTTAKCQHCNGKRRLLRVTQKPQRKFSEELTSP